VGVLIEKNRIAGFGMRADSYLVRHGARHHIDRVLRAKQIRHFALKPFDRGVVAVDIVTDGRRRHGVAHGFGGLTAGITAQVNHGFLHSIKPMEPSLTDNNTCVLKKIAILSNEPNGPPY
jgi:hypothetical protein